MTTAQHMLAVSPALSARAALLSLSLFIISVFGSACSGPKYTVPVAQLPAHPTPNGVVWAVAPLRNESGVSIVDELALTDTLIAEMSDAQGIVVLPVNRTIAAMRALNLPSVDTPTQAHELARALGADAIVVGIITAWNPYEPPVLGISLALFEGAGARVSPRGLHPQDDPLLLRSLTSDGSMNGSGASDQPLAVFSAVFDASNGNTREAIRAYAEGRHDPRSALGWRRYIASMSLYAKFACFEASKRLIASERDRLGVPEARAETSTTR